MSSPSPVPTLPAPRITVHARHNPGTVTAPVAGPSATAASATVTCRALTEALDTLASTPGDAVTIARAYVDLISTLPQVAGAALLQRVGNGSLQLGASNWNGFAFDRDSFRQGVAQACADTAQSGRMRTFVQADARNLVTFCLPVRIDKVRTDVFAVSLAIPFEQSAQYDSSLLTLAATSLALWHSREHSQRLDADLQATAAIVELVAQIERSAGIDLAGHTLVNELREFLSCERVTLALKRPLRGGSDLRVVSGLASFDGRSESMQLYQSASDETSIRNTLATWPPLSGGTHQATLALRKLAEQSHVEAVVGLPLNLTDGRQIGVLTLTGSRVALHEPRILHFLRTGAPALASALHIVQRLAGGRLQRAARAVARTGWVRLVAGTVALGAVCLTLLMPWPYHVRATCTLEPMVRRVVAAPYDGLLEMSLVEPGDTVERDQIVARMDGSEIRWELSGVMSERQQIRKDLERQLAEENIPKAQLAALEGERLNHKVQLLQHREDNHELRSPVAGIVLKGSVERMSSAQVKLGQPLFEVGQLHPLRLEVALPAEEFANVRVGHSVAVSLDGLADRKVEAEIRRIRPRSEIRDGRNVFIAEVEIDNADQRLRPGIQGVVVITGDSHPLGWNLFHRAWEGVTRAQQGYLLSDRDLPSNAAPIEIARRDNQFDKRRRTNPDAPGQTEEAQARMATQIDIDDKTLRR